MDLDRSIPNIFIDYLKFAGDSDLRIGQFMEIIRTECEKKGKDFFNIENGELCRIIAEWMRNRYTT